MVRILYHHRVRSKDGQYVHVSGLIRALERHGHEVSLVEPAATGEAAFGDDATPIREAIRQTVAWARSHTERKPVPSSNAAIRSETREGTTP